MLDADGAPLPGVYCAGWIKRGPTGVIGTNKKDATETVELLLEDARGGRLRPRRAGGGDRRRCSPSAASTVVTYAGWEAIDAAERARGEPQGRPRVKLASWDELLDGAWPAGCLTPDRATPRRPSLDSCGERDGRATRSSGAARPRKAVENFPVSGEPIPVAVAHWLGRIKAAAARVNAELGLLDADKAERIAAAADRVAAGELDDQFPIDVFQTGSGTSSNMNAQRGDRDARRRRRPRRTTTSTWASRRTTSSRPRCTSPRSTGRSTTCSRRSSSSRTSLERKAKEFDDVVKSGRTHLMDAVPVTLGQEFAGYAAQVRQGIARVEDALPRLGQIPLGGTAIGTGLNTHPEFAARCASCSTPTRASRSPPRPIPSRRRPPATALVEASGALKVVAVSLTKIANDLRLHGLRPARRASPRSSSRSSRRARRSCPARSTRSSPRS